MPRSANWALDVHKARIAIAIAQAVLVAKFVFMAK